MPEAVPYWIITCVSDVAYRLAVTESAVGRPRMMLKLDVPGADENVDGDADGEGDFGTRVPKPCGFLAPGFFGAGVEPAAWAPSVAPGKADDRLATEGFSDGAAGATHPVRIARSMVAGRSAWNRG